MKDEEEEEEEEEEVGQSVLRGAKSERKQTPTREPAVSWEGPACSGGAGERGSVGVAVSHKARAGEPRCRNAPVHKCARARDPTCTRAQLHTSRQAGELARPRHFADTDEPKASEQASEQASKQAREPRRCSTRRTPRRRGLGGKSGASGASGEREAERQWSVRRLWVASGRKGEG